MLATKVEKENVCVFLDTGHFYASVAVTLRQFACECPLMTCNALNTVIEKLTQQ